MESLPKSRAEAKKIGSTHYFTGNPCPKGHVAPRFASGGNCVECLKTHNAGRLEYYRERYRKNKDKLLAQQKARYDETREYRSAKAKEWCARNPELSREIKRRYKARRRAQEDGGASARDVLEWKRNQKKVCYWCGAKCGDDHTIDHYEPLSKGGAHELSNLVIACRSCNLRKNARDPYEFAASVGRLF